MSPTTRHLLSVAAELRAVGHPWEAVAQRVRRQPKTCQHWPARFRDDWDRLYRAAQLKRFEEMSNEARTHLNGLMRHDDPKVKQKAVEVWLRCGASAFGPRGQMVPAGPPEAAGPPDRNAALLQQAKEQMAEARDRIDRRRAHHGLPPTTDCEFMAEWDAELEALRPPPPAPCPDPPPGAGAGPLAAGLLLLVALVFPWPGGRPADGPFFTRTVWREPIASGEPRPAPANSPNSLVSGPARCDHNPNKSRRIDRPASPAVCVSPGMAAPRTLPNLRALLDRSGLLPAALLDPAFADAPDPDAALDRLLADRLLTPFQAAQLRKGRPDHFFLTDKYKVLDYVGAGGMGKVYLCEHLILHRLVAVKLLQRAADGPDAARSFERFYREARAVAALSDPNIVRVYDVDRAGGLPFMVMEYVDGSNLHDVVTRHGPLAAGRAANYVGQAALGLQHAHEVGLVHRDVKPGNLMLDRAGTVKLLDLGLARFHADPDRNAGITDRYDKHMVIGTVDFMAPEQAFDTAKVDIRSDIYGLGCTLYFLLTGRVPFPDRTPPEKMYAHKTLAPAPVSEICPRLPPELLDVLDRMTAKDPADRFQTPAEVEAALAAWKDVPPPPAREMPEHPAGFYRLGISPAPELKSPQVSTPDPLSTLETDRTPRPDNWSPPGPSTPRPRARPPATGAEDPSIVLTFPPASGTPGPRLRAARRHKRLVRLTELALFVMCAGAVGWLASREWMHAARPTNPDPAPPPPAAAPREAVAPFAGPVVNAGGVTFADPVMQRWAAVYEKQHGVRVDYQPVGLEKGVQAALDRVYLFGGTVVPLTPGQLAAARAKDGEVLHVPLALGAVAVAYNLPDVADPVRFTGPVLADIYLGKIARWSDPALTVSNPGLRLPDLPIVVVRHAGPTGTTALWTEFLSRTSADWRAKVGTGTDVPWPVGTGAKSNAGTATTVSRTAGAVGYLELSYAVANNLPVGRVQNKDGRFVPPTPGGLSAAAAGLPRPLPADLRYSLTDRPGEDAYPIGGTVWAVLYADQTKRPAGKELVSFLRWALADGQGYLAEAQFAPLPPDVVKLAEDQLSTVRVAER